MRTPWLIGGMIATAAAILAAYPHVRDRASGLSLEVREVEFTRSWIAAELELVNEGEDDVWIQHLHSPREEWWVGDAWRAAPKQIGCFGGSELEPPRAPLAKGEAVWLRCTGDLLPGRKRPIPRRWVVVVRVGDEVVEVASRQVDGDDLR